VISALALFLTASVVLFLYFHRTKAVSLTEKDTILLADIDNTTGDQVFDGALKEALAIQLEQSPFLNIFPEERVRQTLKMMERPQNQPVTKDVAREICQREGLKARHALRLKLTYNVPVVWCFQIVSLRKDFCPQ